MVNYNIVFLVLFLTIFGSVLHFSLSTYYVITEHPNVTYIDNKVLVFANLSTKRYGRRHPLYYVDLHFQTTVTFDESVEFHFYIYEFLSNEYRRSFVEMHNRGCGFLTNNAKFGGPLLRALNNSCPIPAGPYHLYNMTINPKFFPPNFPFTKGRIYANLTYDKVLFVSGYIDMEIKQMRKGNIL